MAYRKTARSSYRKRTSGSSRGRYGVQSSRGRRAAGARASGRRTVSKQRVEVVLRHVYGDGASTQKNFIPGAPGLSQIDTTNKKARF